MILEVRRIQSSKSVRVKLNYLGFLPSLEGTIFVTLDVINALNPLVVQFMGPSICETIINELKTFRPPNVGVKQFKEGGRGEQLVNTLDRDFLCLANAPTNLGSYKSNLLLSNVPIHPNPNFSLFVG